MSGDRTERRARRPGRPAREELLAQYGCGPIAFTGTGDALYDRHLMFDSVLDPAGFGAVTITKSISIVAEDSGEGGITAALVNGIIVNAGASDVVTIRGLVIEGLGTGLNGIRFLAGKALNVERCSIADFRSSSAGSGHGIAFVPSGASQLTVVDSEIVNNGISSNGGGILIQPSGTGSASVAITAIVTVPVSSSMRKVA